MTEPGFYEWLLLLSDGWEVQDVKVEHRLKGVDVFITYKGRYANVNNL